MHLAASHISGPALSQLRVPCCAFSLSVPVLVAGAAVIGVLYDSFITQSWCPDNRETGYSNVLNMTHLLPKVGALFVHRPSRAKLLTGERAESSVSLRLQSVQVQSFIQPGSAILFSREVQYCSAEKSRVLFSREKS